MGWAAKGRLLVAGKSLEYACFGLAPSEASTIVLLHEGLGCIPVCPTGSIDEAATGLEALDDAMAALLADAHKEAGGKARAPASAAMPSINIYTLGKPATTTVQGNYRLTNDPAHDVRHIILDLGSLPFPILEG